MENTVEAKGVENWYTYNCNETECGYEAEKTKAENTVETTEISVR